MPIPAAIPLIISLIGAATSTGAGIAKNKKQEKYQKKLEKSQVEEEERLRQQQRREALARYLDVGQEASLADQNRYRVKQPKTPNLSGYDTASGLGGLASQYGSQWYNYIKE